MTHFMTAIVVKLQASAQEHPSYEGQSTCFGSGLECRLWDTRGPVSRAWSDLADRPPSAVRPVGPATQAHPGYPHGGVYLGVSESGGGGDRTALRNKDMGY